MPAPRRFDWDEARRLRDRGMRVCDIAARFGVTPAAIYFATNPEALARQRERHRLWSADRGECPDCGAPTRRNRLNSDRPCRTCAAKRATVSQHGDEAWCYGCGEWRPLSAFCAKRQGVGRTVRELCRACDTEARRAWREANREHERAYDRERKRRIRSAAA